MCATLMSQKGAYLDEPGEDDDDADGVAQAFADGVDAQDDAEDCSDHLVAKEPPQAAAHAHSVANEVRHDATCMSLCQDPGGCWEGFLD